MLKFIADTSTAFNETCCKVKYVPENCMGMCMEDTGIALRRHAPRDKCEKWKAVIHSCVINEASKF